MSFLSFLFRKRNIKLVKGSFLTFAMHIIDSLLGRVSYLSVVFQNRASR